jgi:hypothetical protein
MKPAVKLGLLLAVFLSLNLLFVFLDRTPPEWDQAVHMMTASRYHSLMAGDQHDHGVAHQSPRHAGGFRRTLGRLIRMETGVYPPLFLFLASWLLFVGHLSVQWMVLANVPFMVLLALSVFGLGREIDRSRGDGALLAVALLFFYPIVFGLSRSFMVDFAALACIALSAYLLLRTEEFRRPGFAALFGLSLGVGALIKQAYHWP